MRSKLRRVDDDLKWRTGNTLYSGELFPAEMIERITAFLHPLYSRLKILRRVYTYNSSIALAGCPDVYIKFTSVHFTISPQAWNSGSFLS